MLADLRLAVRALRRAPGFTLAAALTLGLGLGATTAMFSVVDAVLLRPLPLRDPARVVELVPRVGGDDRGGSPALLAAWGEASRRLAALAGVRGRDATLVRDGGGAGAGAGAAAERLAGLAVSGRFFDVAGVTPVRGRLLGEADDRPDAPRAVVLAEGTWRRAFAADPAVVGRTIRLDGEPHTVVGVAPAAFGAAINDATFFTPLALEPSQRANFTPYLSLVARLAPGATAADAERELDAITARLGAAALVDGAPQRVGAVALDRRLTDAYRRPLLLLLGAVAAVLAIACANVSTLVLARSLARARELAVRVSFGAGRGRLARQLLAEHVVLGALAVAVAVPAAVVGVRALVAAAPPGVPRLADAAVDARALALAALLGLAASLLSGLVPALRQGRPDVGGGLAATLRGGGRTATDRGGERWRRALVGAEVALALALLAGAGLLARSSAALGAVPPGYDTARVLTARFALPERDYPDLAGAVRGYEAVVDAARRAPGVEAAAVVSRVPLGGSMTSVDLARADRAFGPATRVGAALRIAGPGYFAAMGVPLLAGRDLAATDDARAPGVVVVNAALARRLAGGGPPRAALGLRVRSDNGAFADPSGAPRHLEVVGVVGDVRDGGARSEAAPEFYAPLGQVSAEPWNYWVAREVVLVARTRGAPAAAAPGLRRAVAAVDARVPLYDVQTTAERLRGSQAVERFSGRLLVVLGAAGLLLAAVGIHALVAYAAGQRAREVGCGSR
jgi:predicted permease